MSHVGRKITAIAGAELLALMVDLGNGCPLKYIADLLDSRVRVRQSAVSRLQRPANDLDVLCTRKLRIDEALIDCAGMIGRVIDGNVLGSNEVSITHGLPNMTSAAREPSPR